MSKGARAPTAARMASTVSSSDEIGAASSDEIGAASSDEIGAASSDEIGAASSDEIGDAAAAVPITVPAAAPAAAPAVVPATARLLGVRAVMGTTGALLRAPMGMPGRWSFTDLVFTDPMVRSRSPGRNPAASAAEDGRARCGERLHARRLISGNQRTWEESQGPPRKPSSVAINEPGRSPNGHRGSR